jgi:hypothetical protein
MRFVQLACTAAGELLPGRNPEQLVSGGHGNQGLHGLTLVTKVALEHWWRHRRKPWKAMEIKRGRNPER